MNDFVKPDKYCWKYVKAMWTREVIFENKALRPDATGKNVGKVILDKAKLSKSEWDRVLKHHGDLKSHMADLLSTEEALGYRKRNPKFDAKACSEKTSDLVRNFIRNQNKKKNLPPKTTVKVQRKLNLSVRRLVY